MKRRLANVIMAGTLAVMVVLPCNTISMKAAKVPAKTSSEYVESTKTTPSQRRLFKGVKEKIAQFLLIKLKSLLIRNNKYIA